MITYCWFTAREIDTSNIQGTVSELHSLLSRALQESRNWKPADRIILVALDDGRPAGYVKFTYGHVTRHGQSMRVAAAQDLFTHPDYRGRGIGSGLISKSLEIGMPCLYSGISGQAMPLYRKLGFTFIDCAPVYQLPLRLRAIVREWRAWLYHMQDDAEMREKSALRALRMTLRARRNLLRVSAPAWRQLEMKEAVHEVRKMARVQSRMFQIPWSIDLLLSALNGDVRHMHAAVFTERFVAGGSCRLVTIYRQAANVRIPMTRRHLKLADGHLNEIYPPITDFASALGVLSAAARYAKDLGLDNMSIYAMTDQLRSACEHVGLVSSAAKSVAIQPLGLSEALALEIVRPENWWCRMANEEQLEEAIA